MTTARLLMRGVSTESMREANLRRVKKLQAGRKVLSGSITLAAAEDLKYLQQEWGLSAYFHAVEMAIQYTAKATREGLIHPGVSSAEGIPPR